ncbi:hypothetical protein C8F04DRAFT_1388654 [Mycena alexandri]|uniref:histidine kinase n=1 Tax=Mycena alexandri TaxID=1745969 RepID=A0AAD6TJM9_9AGAR|nr:hypothetical protein C8F04DRAFT_1388654 [Mycena alexandri]
MPSSSSSRSGPSNISTTLSFVDRYSNGNFPANRTPEKPSDLHFDTSQITSGPVPQDGEKYTSLQSLAASVKDFFHKFGFLPAMHTLSGELENDRTLVVQRYSLDDPSLWPLIDRCARIAHAVFNAPILITLIHADTQFVLASVGCAYKPRDPLAYRSSLCSHTALRKDGSMLEIPDTQQDWRFSRIPGVPRSYAGQPLLLPIEDGGPLVPVGSFCVINNKPRSPMTPEERASLADLTHLLSTEIQRVFQETRERKETARRNFVSDLIAELATMHSTISPPVVREKSRKSPSPDPESRFRMLSATMDIRRMLEADFVCLVDLSSLHLSWPTERPRLDRTRTLSKSKYGWIGHGQRGSSYPSGLNASQQGAPGPGLRIIDYNCSEGCQDHTPEAVFNAPEAVQPLITFLRSYTETTKSGYVHSGSDGILQGLLPTGSQAHIAIPLFNNAQPSLLLLVSTNKPMHVYEPPDVAFASTFAVLCLGSLEKIKLMKADAAKTAFVSMISHELRTPLHGLLSQLELIREFAPKEFLAETETFLQTAQVCGLTLRDVLNDVLDFGKQEQGTGGGDVQAHCTEVDLGVLAIEAMNVAYGRRRQWESVTGASESAVDVYVTIEDSPTGWGALIDVNGLRRVLLNFASNALKYTPKGSIVLSLRELELEPVDKSSDGRLIEFSITDTGIGMSSEYKKDIFTPFSQESTFNPGAGLGMSISEAIVSKMGGEIEITSELGKGTTVSFTLLIDFLEPRPVRTGPRTASKTLISHDDLTIPGALGSPPQTPTSPAYQQSTSPLDRAARSPLRSSAASVASDEPTEVRVLVVDDNPIGRKILTTLLTRKGVPFREAADGLAALAVYREFLPHLVWTDISMPVMDGIESARRMRMIESELQLRPAHIVALTGLSSHGDMKEGLLGEAALDEWLVKGQANLKTLTSGLAKVQRAMRRRGSSVSSRASTSSPVV